MCVWWGFGKKLKKKRPKRVKHLQQQYTTMEPKVHIQQVFIITAAIFGIRLLWINFNEKVFKTVHHLVSVQFTWSEEKHPTWKGPVSERRRICELMGINWQKEKGTYVRLAAKTAGFFLFWNKKKTPVTNWPGSTTNHPQMFHDFLGIPHYFALLQKYWLYLHQTWRIKRRQYANYFCVKNVRKC